MLSNFPEIKEETFFYVVRKLVRCDRQKFMKRKSSGSWHLIKRLGLLETRNFQRLEIILELGKYSTLKFYQYQISSTQNISSSRVSSYSGTGAISGFSNFPNDEPEQ